MNDATDSSECVSREMPRYKCHKEVWALKIKAIEQAPATDERMYAGGDWLLVPEDAGYGPVRVGHEDYVLRHKPQVGGYYVVYDDGYKSYSPAAAFEGGYSLIKPADYRQRVRDEKSELDEKLAKLLAFFQSTIFADQPEAERSRLRNQARFMDGYAAILEERIKAFAA